MTHAPYRTLIGLEVHVQLKTQTKLFCRCVTTFGSPPNTQTCPVCIGMPGSLPKLNGRAIELARKTGVALHCRIPRLTKWDRKNYFYPDLPKGYQISQFDLPIAADGYLDIQDPRARFPSKRVRIIRAHLEEDAGKSMHDEVSGTADSRIDLNRAGTPLLEIVSHPDLASPLEAKTYLTELKLLLQYLDVSDCNMQEGSLRVDANVNLELDVDGRTVATPIVEVKNMNSFRAVERALAYEVERQYAAWKRDGKRKGDVPKETRGWDDQAEVTRSQRTKEESSDYRYFPEPDLVPVITDEATVTATQASLGELPADLRKRLQSQYGLDPSDSDVLVNQGPRFVAYFEETVRQGGVASRTSNWLQQDILRLLREREESIEHFPVRPKPLAELLLAVEERRIDTTRARDVLQRMVEQGESPSEAMKQLGVRALDTGELESLCRRLLDDHPRIVQDVQAGKTKALGALIGQARKIDPNANPQQVRETCLRLIEQAAD